MSTDLNQLAPWGDARLDKVEDVSVTFQGQTYSWTTHELAPAVIAASRAKRLSETELEVFTSPDPDPQDTIAPTLSNPTGTATGETTAQGSVDTDEADGVLYWVVTTSQAAPSAQQVADGENDGGNTAAAAGARLVGPVGTQGIAVEGLSGSTTYYLHYMQEDEAGSRSSVASSASITTT
jgi:hypothetical protein